MTVNRLDSSANPISSPFSFLSHLTWDSVFLKKKTLIASEEAQENNVRITVMAAIVCKSRHSLASSNTKYNTDDWVNHSEDRKCDLGVEGKFMDQRTIIGT